MKRTNNLLSVRRPIKIYGIERDVLCIIICYGYIEYVKEICMSTLITSNV